jgi:hypothetical protein
MTLDGDHHHHHDDVMVVVMENRIVWKCNGDQQITDYRLAPSKWDQAMYPADLRIAQPSSAAVPHIPLAILVNRHAAFNVSVCARLLLGLHTHVIKCGVGVPVACRSAEGDIEASA